MFALDEYLARSHAAVAVGSKNVFMAAVALAAAYYAGVQIGAAFRVEPNAVSLLWPPNAIVLAALLLAPVRTWGWLIAAILPVHLYAQLRADVPWVMSVCWYVSNSFEALLGAGIIRAVLERTPRFDTVREVAVFLFIAALIAPFLSSFLDAGFVAAVGWRYDGDYWHLWRLRLFSNALAATIVAPLILIIGGTRPAAWRKALRECGLEAGVLFTLLIATSWFVFHRDYAIGEGAGFLYAPLPLLVWAALRLGVGAVVACVGLVALTSLSGEMRGLGPFSGAVPEDAVFFQQTFLLLVASSLMLLAAALEELKEAQATASRRKESLDLALGAARMGVWNWDISSDRVRWRWGPRGGQGVTSSAEALAFVHRDDRSAVQAALHRARSGEASCEAEYRFERHGSMRWMMVKGKGVRDGRGHVQRVVGIFMDTTHWKERDMKEQSHRDELAHLSRVAMLGELSGAIAHELRQPLAAMLFNAQTALRELAGPKPDLGELAAMLEDIVADDTRAAEVIRRLRALFIRGAVQSEPVDVGECIRTVLALEHSDLIMRKVAVELHLADMPVVSVDPIQLQQVLLNLVVNACEAMASVPTGERRLRISTRLQAGEVWVSVCDSGSGISHPERIFEPFFSTKSRGIGLGLAISRTILGAHGGRLWGSNNADRGASFHLSLPCRDADPTES